MSKLRFVVALMVLGSAGAVPAATATTAAGTVQTIKTGTIAFGTGAAPAATAARQASWSGTVEKGGTISFRVVRGRHKVKRVIVIGFSTVFIRCQNPAFVGTIVGEAKGGKVRHHRFVGRATDATGATVTVRGKFGRKYRHAHGTLTIHGNVGNESNCSSGRLRWQASRPRKIH